MTISFLCWEYPPTGSGIGRYVAEMASALSDVGHQVVVLTSRVKGMSYEETRDNVLLLRAFDREEIRSQRVARMALETARAYHADWIEVADHWGEGATLVGIRNRPPVVVKMHYNDVLKFARYAQAWYPWQKLMIDCACWRQWRSLAAERYSLAHANALLAPCGRILKEAQRQGLPLAAKRAVVPNPIRRLDWQNAESATPTLLLVGRLDIGKGLPYLQNLLETLVPRLPGVRLEIAGGDSYARGIGSVKRWFEKRLGTMRHHVTFLGVLSAEQMDAAYRRAWVVIVPSRWDTFPQVVLESMVREKAIVASPHGGMPEMLEGTTCHVAEPQSIAFADAITTLCLSPDERKQAGCTAQRRACAVYDARLIAPRYLETIRSLL